MKGKVRILVLEDDPEISEVLECLLVHNGFRVVRVAFLAAARAELARRAFQALIVDANLPDGSSVGLIDDVAANKYRRNRRVPVIVITGDVTSSLLAQLAGKVAVVLEKPFRYENLLAYLPGGTE